MDFLFLDSASKKPYQIPLLIAGCSIAVILLNLYGFTLGITNVLPHLFYLPIIITAYYYPRRGVLFALGLSVLYSAAALTIAPLSTLDITAVVARSGVFIVIAGVVSILTEQLHHDTQLFRQLNVDHKAIIDNAPAMIWYKDTKNNFIRVNPAGARAFGMTVDAIEGKSCYSLFPDFAENYYQDDLEVINSGIPKLGIVEPMTTARGEHLWVQTDKIPLKNEVGTVTGLLVFAQDITGRKRAEDALRESEEKYRAFFITSRDTIFITTTDGRWVDFNDAAVELFGFESREDMLKTSVADIYANPSDRDRHMTYIREKGYSFEYPVDLKRKDGSIINTLVTTVARKDAAGNSMGFQGSVRDITELRSASDALQLANRKLNLLSSITRHDISNQLMALNAYISLCEDAVDSPTELKEFFEREWKITEILAEQISFARDYEDMGLKAPAWQNVNNVVRKVIAQLPMRSVKVDAEGTDLEIFADPLLVRVFYNLIDNALRYGGEKMTSIHMASREDGENLVIVVEDDGNGIRTEDKTHLFTKGYGIHTGLGLFLSREILSITRITITENGEPGKGARFEIKIPKGAYRLSETA